MSSRTVALHRRILWFIVLGFVVSAAEAGAQAPVAASASARNGKKPVTVDDYSRWRTIQGAEISGHGKWVAYTLRYTNVLPRDSKPVLHLRNLDTDQTIEIPDAHDATFSPDSRWVIYQVDSVDVRARRGARGGGAGDTTAVPDSSAAGDSARAANRIPRMELRDLTTGRTQSWQRVTSATFNRTSTHLILQRRPAPAGGGARGSGAGARTSRGADAILHELATGRSLFLGSVGEIEFNPQGDLAAWTVDATTRDGNGLFLAELRSGRMQVLDNDSLLYARLAWSDDGNRLAVLKGREVEKMRERSNVLLAFTSVRAPAGKTAPAPVTLDPARAATFPKGFVVSERAPLSWSEDGRHVFLGIIQQTAAPDTARRRSTDSIPNVDIWRTQDERIQSVQMIQAEAERNFTFRQSFDVNASRFVQLTDSAMRTIELSPDGRWAVGRDTRAYISDYEPATADLYRVNTATGERTLMLKGQLIGQHVLGFSPDGRHYLYWKDDRFHAWDMDAGQTKALANPSEATFVNQEFDRPGPRPSYGVAGYASDGRSVIVNHRYDLWQLPLDGGPARNLTNGVGTEREMRFRYVRTEPIDPAAPRRVRTGDEIDLSKPITLSAYGEYTKKAGFYTLAGRRLEPLVYDDAIFSTPVRARHADRVLFTRQTVTEFPDLQVASASLKDAKKITNANPQQAEYMWGRRVLFDYEVRGGIRLQGVLTLPDDYQPGEKRPMIVSFYEKNSQNLHRYPTPSFLTGMGSLTIEAQSRGYITMLADVHFRTGSSHSDMLEAVEAATRKVIEMGYADPARIGVHGHSYGGEGAAFIGTRSKLFAAVGMGAGVTDLYTDFSQSWGWSYQINGGSGANGSAYYLYGQGRWGKSPWDDPELYRNESAMAHAPEASAPFLIMHGTDDPTVSFTEGMNFYNALRYNGKTAYMLAYPGEGHGLRGLANRRDLTIRYFEFFDHYLKGEPAPKWMTEGVPYIVKERSR